MKLFFMKFIFDNSEMSITVIFNIYSMWYKHMYHDLHDFFDLSWERNINQVKNNDDINVETNEKWITSWFQKHSFRHIIINENHAVKNECTWVHKFIAALKILNHWIIIAISIINKVLDLKSYFYLLYYLKFNEITND